MYDELTGLPNRNLIGDRIDHALQRAARRNDYQFGVLVVDLDDFAVTTERLGRELGDLLLIDVSRSIEACLRLGDSIGRLEGDRFAALLEHVGTVSDATRVADRIFHELGTAFRLGGHEVAVSASIGIALSGAGYEEAEDLLRDAAAAMGQAKARGKARYEIFNPLLRETAGPTSEDDERRRSADQAAAAILRAKRAQRRLEGVVLASRDLAHDVGDDLGAVTAALGLISRRAGLPDDVQAAIGQTVAALQIAARRIEELDGVARAAVGDDGALPWIEFLPTGFPSRN